MPERICSIPDCPNPHVARGWCNKHYTRWRKRGDPLPYVVQPAVEGERWAPVVGFEGTYEVSDQGRVRRITMGAGTFTGRVLRDVRSGAGYRKVNLYGIGPRQPIYVHRLVAAAFLGPCLDGRNVNHKNGIKTDNRLVNLEYVSGGDNTRHAARTGLLRTGEQHQNARLTIEQVAEIRRLYQPWTYSTHRLAREFGVNAQTIHNIIKGRTWSS